MYPWFHTLQMSVYSETAFVILYGEANFNMGLNSYKWFNSANFPQITRYTKCHVFFHAIQVDTISPEFNHLEESDPNFVIYFSNYVKNDKATAVTLKQLEHHLSSLNYSGVPLYLDQTGKLQIIQYVSGRILLHHLPTNNFDLSKLKMYWSQKIQRSFHGLIVTSLGSQNSRACEISRSHNRVLPFDTLWCTLDSKLNISVVFKNNAGLGSVDIYADLVVNQKGINRTKICKSQNAKYQYSVSTMKTRPYSFIIVDNRISSNSFYAITRPFQVKVWLCIIFFALIISLACTVTSIKGPVQTILTIQNYFDWSITVFGYTVRQSYGNMENLLRSWQSSGLWLIWVFVSIIISYSYDGQLYSFLASETYLVSYLKLNTVVQFVHEKWQTNKQIIVNGTSWSKIRKQLHRE